VHADETSLTQKINRKSLHKYNSYEQNNKRAAVKPIQEAAESKHHRNRVIPANAK
jgi:hypothetical protein